MAIGKIIIGALAALGLGAVALIEFPDEIQTYAPNLIPAPLAKLLPPPLPRAEPPRTAYWLDQNWRQADRRWLHHASQGTATFQIPYSWFVALEQPYIWLFGQPGMLRDGAFLQRLGFIPSPKTDASAAELRAHGFGWSSAPEPAPIEPSTSLGWDPAPNDNGLPVGFARLKRDDGPDMIGLTCAACHSGHLEYKGASLRIDGAGAVIDLEKLKSVLEIAVAYTAFVPGRFDRFAERVVGPNASAAQKAALKQDFLATAQRLKNQDDTYDRIVADSGQSNTLAGAGRLDALNKIGNQVFYTDLVASGVAVPDSNFHATDAPVSFPPIWDVPWFFWAQYDASIEQPLIRNVGESMGVAALLTLGGADPAKLYHSSVRMNNLLWIEDLLRGPDPFAGAGAAGPAFSGLGAPKWPAALFPDDPAWRIDPAKVERGRKLYAELCAGCHLGPVNDPEFDKSFPERRFWQSKHWLTLPRSAEKILAPPEIPVAEIGTDPARALVLLKREVDAPKNLGIVPQRDLSERWSCGMTLPDYSSGHMPFSLALMVGVDDVIRKWMDEHDLSPATRAAALGPLKNCPNPAQQAIYRTRPLDGVWATAPYLHNGSVPSLYWLLRPAAERPRHFCVGASDFDPQTVGFATAKGGRSSCAIGETQFTAEGAGNDNSGHSFEDGPRKPGVIGRALSEDERYDLIDYLKTL